jgi:hypothetical protein
MGMGRGNSSLRAIRLGLLVMVILAGVVFHHSGGVYDTIHVIYIVLIVGFLVFALATRRRGGRQPQGGTAGGSWGGPVRGQWGAGTSAPATPSSAPATPPAPPSDRPVGLVDNEHDLGPSDPPPDAPTN